MSAPRDGAEDTGRGSPYWRRYFEAAAHEGDDHARVGYTNARYAALMHDTLRRALGPLAGRRVLDAGSGDGQVLGPFAGEARIVAMDFTSAMAARAARRGLVAVRADVTRPPFRARSFDDVLCAEVLTQVDRPAEAVAGLATLVRPGGRIVLSGLNQRSVLRHLVRTIGRLRGVVEPALIDPMLLVRTLRDAGFEVEPVWWVGYVPAFVARPRSALLHALLGFPATNFVVVAHRRGDAA